MFGTKRTCITVTSIMLGISVVCCFLRYYTRLRVVRIWGLDDWFSVAALAFAVLATVFGWAPPYDRPMPPPNDLVPIMLQVWLHQIVINVATVFIRVSFALTLQKFLRFRWQSYIVWAAVVLVIAQATTMILLVIFTCDPVSYYWRRIDDPYLLTAAEGKDPASLGLKPGGKCINQSAAVPISYVNTSCVCVTDFILGVITPIMIFKGLQMRTKVKWGAGLLLATGALPLVASLVKMSYIPAMAKLQGLRDSGILFIWSMNELDLCLIATSVSTLKPLFFPQDTTYYSDNSSNAKHNSVDPAGRNGIHDRGLDIKDVEMVDSAAVSMRSCGENDRTPDADHPNHTAPRHSISDLHGVSTPARTWSAIEEGGTGPKPSH